MATEKRAPVMAADRDAFKTLMNMPPEKRRIADLLIRAINAAQYAPPPQNPKP